MNLKNMSVDERKDWIETFIGGACGVAAIVAAIVEYALGDNGAVAGMLKDVFGTAVVVVLLIMATPTRKPKSMAKILEDKVEKWGADNAPMIFKAEGYVQAQNSAQTQCFLLLQDPQKEYISLANQKMTKNSPNWMQYAKYGRTNRLTGKFLDMPSYEDMTNKQFEMLLCLEQSHFTKMPEIDTIVTDLSNAITAHCDTRIAAKRIGSSHTIRLSCAPICSIQEVDDFVEHLDFILSLVKVVA